ncbi:MAG: hypothetical protein AB7S26_27655 [Sandaracinaceae bacterium]
MSIDRSPLLVWALALLVGCGGSGAGADEEDTATSTSSLGSGDEDDDAVEREGTDDGASSDRDADEPPVGVETDEEPVPVNPDSISATPSHAVYTHCSTPVPSGCTECGLEVEVRRRRGWRAGAYAFEILTEGNHIRCEVSLPCEGAGSVPCHASPGAPQVRVELDGCGGPEAEQSIRALRFQPDACPVEMRIESYRDQIRAAVQDLRPRYADVPACGASCAHATARHDMAR